MCDRSKCFGPMLGQTHYALIRALIHKAKQILRIHVASAKELEPPCINPVFFQDLSEEKPG